MATLNALDDELRCSLLAALAAEGLEPTELAHRLGMGEARMQDLLEGRAGFTSRDIMLIMGAGLMPTEGAVSGRKASRAVRPMVFLPDDRDCAITRAGAGYDAGLDVRVSDVSGDEVILKLSIGVAREITNWMEAHAR